MFTYDDMQRLLSTRPFVPFRLHLSDGGVVDVRHQELAIPGKRYAIVALPDPHVPDAPFDKHTLVFYLHVTRDETLLPGAAPGQAPPAGPASSPAGTPS